MCYRVKQAKHQNDYSSYYDASKIDEVTDNLPHYHANGFEHPILNIITFGKEKRQIEKMQWGLMPNWGWDLKKMTIHSNNTLNAKSETIYDVASFKNSIENKRCILPVEGFYEYKEEKNKKLPFFIYPKENPYFNLACIFSYYKNPANGEWIKSFSIATGEANELMASIHNTKKRMPLIIDNAQIDNWLNPNISREEINHLMTPCDDSRMSAYRVSRNLIKLGNVPEAFAPVED